MTEQQRLHLLRRGRRARDEAAEAVTQITLALIAAGVSANCPHTLVDQAEGIYLKVQEAATRAADAEVRSSWEAMSEGARL